MKSSSLLIAAFAAAITPAHAAEPPQVGDIITLPVQTLACFDLDNTKELERTRAMDGLSAALQFVDRHPLPDNPAAGTGMFTNVCSRFGPSGTMYRVKKIYDWTSGGLTLFCIDPATKWTLGPVGDKKEPPAESADACWWDGSIIERNTHDSRWQAECPMRTCTAGQKILQLLIYLNAALETS
jgi:hypothetical protein